MVNKKDEKNKRDAINRQIRVAKQRTLIIEKLGGKCVSCDFDDNRALAIDHKYGGGTKERKTIGGGYYTHILKKINDGSDEYQILCFNCNQIKKIENNEERIKKHIAV